MPKNYIYRMDHDTGFAPHIKYGICTLCGCKRTSIEKLAKEGSWVIAIGGNNSGQPDKVIYVMEVESKLDYSRFKKKYPNKSRYLQGRCESETPVLISRKFYYFGENAFDLPKNIKHIIVHKQGCKKISESDIEKLKKHIISITKGKGYGVYGRPNNIKPEEHKRC